MKIKTSELTDAALDWAVWVAAGGAAAYPKTASGPAFLKLWKGNTAKYVHPSTNWEQGGQIIDREAHNLFKHNGGTEWCCACNVPRDGYTAIVTADGPTPLIAAMRCFCCSKLGDVVDIPEELCQQQRS